MNANDFLSGYIDSGLTNKGYKPDILTCLANLSNDEVFTPPSLANEVLDLLPQSLFESPDTKFLDPVCKSGVFLREIARRLMKGLELSIPDEQQRRNHIFTQQIYGMAITSLTAQMSRRSLYCSKTANGKYSVCTTFKGEKGNISFRPIPHTFKNGSCIHCGASEKEYGEKVRTNLESHAYEFIHLTEKQEKELKTMKFDVIIGNPPYQLSDGGAGASATPIFQFFVEQAKKLSPRYLTMIIPAKWYSGGKGLDEFRRSMLTDKRLQVIHDFKSASDCFAGVEIKGGVMYFLWDRDNQKSKTKVVEYIGNQIVSEAERPLLETGLDFFIRHNKAISILNKVLEENPEIRKGESFAKLVSSRRPFAFPTNFTDFSNSQFEQSVKIFANKKMGYVLREDIMVNTEWVDKWKIFTAKANNIGTESPDDNLNTIIAPPNTCCTETYLVVGGNLDLTSQSAKNLSDYIQTKFIRFLISLRKPTQDAVSKVYSLVPIQNYNESWSDKKLYKKYNLTNEEIDYIEAMIAPMDLNTQKVTNGGDDE